MPHVEARSYPFRWAIWDTMDGPPEEGSFQEQVDFQVDRYIGRETLRAGCLSPELI